MWYGIVLTIGLILFGFGVARFNRSLATIRAGERVSATVAEVESYRDSDNDLMYRPVFQYHAGGEKRTFIYKVGSSPSSWEVGDQATLVVPHDDGDILVLTYFGAFGWTIVSISIALPMIFIGAGYFWATRYLQKLTVHL
ncbi:DUF3592 domain-containing protein [Flaviaesturariibacter amylovorans]|uniref:DUF3592 domain-containing protein n=1 Tax=Flaviaesturariibacter amylovorans TaxID=1084520 RepID=A0ABP8GJH6_9BACT